MIHVKVTFEDGNYLYTGINATLTEAKEYYLNNTFTIANKRVKGIKVEDTNVHACPTIGCGGTVHVS